MSEVYALFTMLVAAVVLPILAMWVYFSVSEYYSNKESFSTVYAAMQREIKLKEIHNQAMLVASTKKLDWQQDRAYKDEYKRLRFLANI
jgi:hypothetical protein